MEEERKPLALVSLSLTWIISTAKPGLDLQPQESHPIGAITVLERSPGEPGGRMFTGTRSVESTVQAQMGISDRPST